MRQGQQSRRGRNRGRKPQNAISRNYESSGPDVKIRGTAMHIAEKYASLARDAMSSGDTVAAENYLQHAEHYNRIILAAQAQNPGLPGMEGEGINGGGGRFNQPDGFQRDYDGEGDEGDNDDYVPQQRHYQERSNYNQHHQPQPFIPQNAFPQVQPQPAIPSANGAPAQNGEVFGAASEGDRSPRRRRRRPIGDGQPNPAYPRRNGSGHGAQLNGLPAAPGDTAPDEAAS
jgi:hypothetical protein